MTNSVTPYFTNHDNDNSSRSNNPANYFEKSKVLYGSNTVIDMALQFASNAENKIDACVDYTRQSLIVEIRELKKAFQDAKKEV